MHALGVSSVTHPPSCLRSSLFAVARMKRAQFGPHDWLSLPVPPGPNWLLVDALEPETAYQFSVLAQNRLGTSAFSEVVTVNTLGEAPRRGAEGPRRSWGGSRSRVVRVVAGGVLEADIVVPAECQEPSWGFSVVLSLELPGKMGCSILWGWSVPKHLPPVTLG